MLPANFTSKLEMKMASSDCIIRKYSRGLEHSPGGYVMVREAQLLEPHLLGCCSDRKSVKSRLHILVRFAALKNVYSFKILGD